MRDCGAVLDRPVCLIGFMGAGKSRVGKVLGKRLGRPVIDTDSEIENTAGKRIARIFAEDGEAAFRAAETAALARACRHVAVVATGGGAFLFRANRRWLLDNAWVIWLDVPLDELRRRLDRSPGDRPLWPSGDRVAQHALWSRRAATYALAHRRVWAGGTHPGEVARRVQTALASLLF